MTAYEVTMLNFTIKQDSTPGEDSWLEMRRALWPHCTREEHLAEMQQWCSEPDRHVVFLAYDKSGEAIAFAEAAIRTDYVNGTETSPVGFLEGIYVTTGARQQGAARALVSAVEHWAASKGCRELASDADLKNKTSHLMHRALGFEETERVVFFRKILG